MDGTPKQNLIAYLRTMNVIWLQALKFLIVQYANNETILQNDNAIKSIQQLKKLEARQIEIFIHVIAPSIREQTHRYWSDNSRLDLESLVALKIGHYAIPQSND